MDKNKRIYIIMVCKLLTNASEFLLIMRYENNTKALIDLCLCNLLGYNLNRVPVIINVQSRMNDDCKTKKGFSKYLPFIYGTMYVSDNHG